MTLNRLQPLSGYFRGLISARLAAKDHWGLMFASDTLDWPTTMIDTLPRSLRAGALIIGAHETRSINEEGVLCVAFVFLPKHLIPAEAMIAGLQLISGVPVTPDDEQDIFMLISSEAPDWAVRGCECYLQGIKSGTNIWVEGEK